VILDIFFIILCGGLLLGTPLVQIIGAKEIDIADNHLLRVGSYHLLHLVADVATQVVPFILLFVYFALAL